MFASKFPFGAVFVVMIGIASYPVKAAAENQGVVYYPRGTEDVAESSLPFKVLQLGLAKSGKTFVLKPSPIGKANALRTASAMVGNGPIDVEWVGANLQDDQKMLPVPFPIDMGLLGYRLFLIDGSRQAEFSEIKTLSELKGKVALQGAGWPDVEILRSAGLHVRTGPTYTDLFRMLLGGRADYFPRGALEAFGERDKFMATSPGLSVERSLALHYPFTIVFYVKKTNKALHDDLYRGLIAAVDDGSYKSLFLKDPEVQAVLANAHFATRRIIEIDNPYLSAELKAIDGRFWFKPSALAR